MTRAGFRLVAGLALVTMATSLSAQEPAAFTSQFRGFAATHCVGCHGPDVQRSKLRLDTLSTSFADKDTAATWVKVLDRLARGEMPPKGKERPPEKDTRAVLTVLQRQLRSSLARQHLEAGRSAASDRTEYETTLRDLLGSSVDVKGFCRTTARPPAVR